VISFAIQKSSKRSRARLGILKTPHGEVETPTLVPVATQAVVKTLTSEQVVQTGTQLLIANTFHLHLKPGEKAVGRAGGLHNFMQWKRPLMTDSAGYQVFSLGFGMDLGSGKIGKGGEKRVQQGEQPQHIRITERGVHFRSPVDGSKLFIGPKESMAIQEQLGADIMFAFDECPPPSASKAYMAASVERTHRWALQCIKMHKTRQALFGIVQGGKYKDLRRKSAEYIASLPFSGFGIGGEFGADKATMEKMVGWVTDVLPEKKPRHLLGIGHPEDIPRIIKAGVDTFDCIVPTHYARHGTAFIGTGRLDMTKTVMLSQNRPLDSACACAVCTTYTRAYISHLVRAKEITGLSLLTFHNLWYFNQLVAGYRKQIQQGKL
jgi:tRNA-guanine transglycosylase